MKTTENKYYWDAKRLVQQYFNMLYLMKSNHGKPLDNMAWSNQIRVKRIASALSAFMGWKNVKDNPVDLILSVFDDWDFEKLFENSPIQEEDHAKMMALLKKAMNDDYQYNSLTRMDRSFHEDSSHIERDKLRDRQFMLHMLMRYRGAAEKLISHFDGLMEGTVGVYLCVLAIKESSIEPLKRSCEMIDDIIVLLLGDKFKQSFSEEELKANYGYPKESDEELSEWDCDNM
jgi:hypothetical protein